MVKYESGFYFCIDYFSMFSETYFSLPFSREKNRADLKPSTAQLTVRKCMQSNTATAPPPGDYSTLNLTSVSQVIKSYKKIDYIGAQYDR